MNRSRAFDKVIVALLLCVLAWPVWQVVSEQGVVPFLTIPLGLAATSILVVYVLDQPLEALVGVLFWLGAAAMLAGGVLDRETGFPGNRGKFGITLEESPTLFLLVMLINLAVVVAGAGYVLRKWRTRAA